LVCIKRPRSDTNGWGEQAVTVTSELHAQSCRASAKEEEMLDAHTKSRRHRQSPRHIPGRRSRTETPSTKSASQATQAETVPSEDAERCRHSERASARERVSKA
jgi:hypothetical protein